MLATLPTVTFQERKPYRVDPIDLKAACDQGYRRLAASVVRQALHDLTSDRPEVVSNARTWLLGEGSYWAEALGIDPDVLTARVLSILFNQTIEGE
jgi:hypothetical protein